MPKKEKEKLSPKVVAKAKEKDTGGLIEVGVPGEIATVGRAVKKVFYRGEPREVIECNTRQRELELQDKDSVTVLDSSGDPSTIYLK